MIHGKNISGEGAQAAGAARVQTARWGPASDPSWAPARPFWGELWVFFIEIHWEFGVCIQ